MVDRYPGPWDLYEVPGSQIRAAAEQTSGRIAAVDAISRAVDQAHRGAIDAVEGELAASVRNAPTAVLENASRVQQDATLAAGAMEYFANAVDDFDANVSGLNRAWFAAMHDPDLRRDPDRLEQLRTTFDGRWQQFDAILDDEAARVTMLLDQGATEGNVRMLLTAGCLPPYAPLIWPGYTFTQADARLMVQEMIEHGQIPDFATMSPRAVEEWLRAHPEYLPLAAQGLLPDPAASEDRDEMSIEAIVERYRVETNPDGTVEFPGGFLGGIFGNTEIQTTEAAVLDELSLLEQKDFKDIQGDALSTAEERYPGYALHNDQADAFRHAYWSALMATRFGEGFSESFGNAHETNEGQPQNEMTMDLYNNELGRLIAAEHPDADPDELASLIQQELENGRGLSQDDDGELVRTGEAPGSNTDGGHDSYDNDPGSYDYGDEPETGY